MMTRSIDWPCTLFVDGDGAGWHERKLRELDRETLAAVELGRERLLDRQNGKHVRRQIRQRAERRTSAGVAQLDEHDVGQRIAYRHDGRYVRDELNALLLSRVVGGV